MLLSLSLVSKEVRQRDFQGFYSFEHSTFRCGMFKTSKKANFLFRSLLVFIIELTLQVLVGAR